MKTVVFCLFILGLAAPVWAQITIIPQSSNPLNSLLQQYQTQTNTTQTNPQQQQSQKFGFNMGFGNPFYAGMHNNQFFNTPNSQCQPDWSQGIYGTGMTPFYGTGMSPYGRR
jgi:hypothetical protein